MHTHTLSRYLLLLALASGALSVSPAAADPSRTASVLPRRWDAVVIVNGVEIPFPFEIVRRGSAVVGSFFNGERRVRSTSGRIEGERLVLTFGQYGTTLDASVTDGRLRGEYRRGAKIVYPFTAVPAAPVRAVNAGAPSIDGTWIVRARSSKGETAWRFIAHEEDGRVSATILRVDGDTGTLTGAFDHGRYVLSHFSGARPLLLEVFPRDDGSLDLRQNGRTDLIAVRASDPRAADIGAPSDPDSHTTVRSEAEPFQFRFPDLSGRIVSNADPKFAGKVVLVSISGSWCPNCHDEAPFLAALYKKYRDRGFEVVTLSFEEKEQLANPERLRAFIAAYGFQHTVLLAGEPGEVGAKVPQAVNLDAFPTSFILGRDGRVRAVHAGFPSPGSGVFYRKAEDDVSRQIERLLAEHPGGPPRPVPTIEAQAVAAHATPGSSAHLRLKVVLPDSLHVQSDKPRDASLIPTALTIGTTSGISTLRVTYPKATDLEQRGREQPLAVFGGTFVIDTEVLIPRSIRPGTLEIPGELRYQSCTAQVCFPPSRANVSWRVTVDAPSR